ncbi:MAG TPA: M28 family peptidase [Clostridia bacterium]
MKKIFALALTIILIMTLSFFAPQKIYAQNLEAISDTQEFMDRFLDDCPNRTSFSEDEKRAAEWLAQEFESFGLQTKTQTFDAVFDNKKLTSQNVIAKLDLGKSKQVIISAHYDNLYGSKDIEGFGAEGAYNNGSGVAVMLSLAKRFSELKEEGNLNLDFNIIFLALGGDEPGLYGASYYVKNMMPREISGTLLAVNLDCVGGGDYLYLYCDELSTVHEKYIKDIADKNNLDIKLPPANKKTATASTPLVPYLHYGLNSANIYFLSAGINSANFFSRNWDTNNKIGIVESEKNKPIIYTVDDNRETLRRLYGDSFIKKMNTAANIIFYALTDKDFVKTMEQSSANKPDYKWLVNSSLMAYIKFGLIVIMIAAVILIVRNLNVRYPVPVITIRPTPPPTVFGEEYENKDKDKDNDQKTPFDGY